MDRFFEAIDITTQLRRALQAIRSIPNGLPSLLLCAVFLLICCFLWPWIWYLDLDATRAFGEDKAQFVLATGIPFPDPSLAGWSLLGGLLLFTLLELGTPVLARYGVSVASWLLWCAIAMDAYTDFPRVNAIMLTHYAWFIASAGGFWGNILFWLVRAALLFLATVGLELFFVVLAICAVGLLLKGLLPGSRQVAVATKG